MFIDAHCHINSLSKEEIDSITSSCRSNYTFIDSSINFQSTLNSLQLSAKYSCVYSAAGFHPFSAKEFNEATIADYKKVLQQTKRIVAIGEIGLDEFADTPLKEQGQIFCRFLELAKEFNLPIVIHNRLSEPSIFGMLDKYFTSYERIIFHCFSYPKDFLQNIIAKGGYASFSLNVLRKKKDITESLKAVTFENMLLETDSPYMKIDGCPSSPLDIERVYSFAAATKNVSVEKLKEFVSINANKLFLLK
ncbi:MAG: TatD family hydrolase [Candidatus Omnitrophota bacterium]